MIRVRNPETGEVLSLYPIDARDRVEQFGWEVLPEPEIRKRTGQVQMPPIIELIHPETGDRQSLHRIDAVDFIGRRGYHLHFPEFDQESIMLLYASLGVFPTTAKVEDAKPMVATEEEPKPRRRRSQKLLEDMQPSIEVPA